MKLLKDEIKSIKYGFRFRPSELDTLREIANLQHKPMNVLLSDLIEEVYIKYKGKLEE